uniref:T9SS type A sorting domain-containing protein n=1 Tax=candidate division WOR-3 bacterium TaxID=2052148 RepID=A0A7C3UX50_UNCW3
MRRILFILALPFTLLFAQRVIFGDDFTTFPGSWTLGGTPNEYWSQKETNFFSHSYSVKCTPHSEYRNNVSVWMERAVNFTNYDIGTITFWVYQNTEEGDFLEFSYSTDNGSTWSVAWERDGFYPVWQCITISEIPNSANRIRFTFTSDSGGVNEGVYLDDVIAYGVARTLTVIFYDGMDDFPTNWTLWGNYPWTRVTNRSNSAPYSAKCSPINGYGYYNNQNNGIDRFFRLSDYDYGIFRFSLYRYLEQGRDSIYVQYRLGDTWRTLMTRTGRYQQWASYSFILPRNADGIRFHFKSNDTITYDGVYLDDVILYGVSTPRIDIWTLALTQPPGSVDSGSIVPVQAEIGNNSPAIAGTPVYYRIGNFYNALAIVDPIYPYATTLVNFPEWRVALPPGSYPRKCTTAYFNDFVSGNNTQSGWILVSTPQSIKEGEKERKRVEFISNPRKELTYLFLRSGGRFFLKIYSPTGNLLFASGENSLENLPRLPSGVYIFLLEIGGKGEEKKLVILR